MPESAFGLPVHPLVVHAAVVVLPSAALAVALSCVWPRFRTWANWLPLAIATVGVVLVPLSTYSGESLEESVPESSLVDRHADLAEMMLPWAVGLLCRCGLLVVPRC